MVGRSCRKYICIGQSGKTLLLTMWLAGHNGRNHYYYLIFLFMAERETKEFSTVAGTKFVLKSYLTGREAADIKGTLLSSLKMSMSDLESKKVDMGGISGAVLVEQERKTLTYLLVSVNGDSERPVETLLDLPSTEYDAVLKEVEKIKNPTTPEK